MKSISRILIVFVLVSLLPSQPVGTVFAEDQLSTSGSEPYSGQPICLPDVYFENPGNCLALGPSSYLTDLAEVGIYFPIMPLPTLINDPTLSQMDQSYLVVTKDSIPLYDTLEDAVAHRSSESLGAGFKYLSKKDRVDENNQIFYQVGNGYWINADEADAKCCIVTGRFQGLTFSETPQNSFGWILDVTTSRTGPSYDYPETAKQYFSENIVQIYSVKDADNTTWYRIGPEEWIERRYIRPLDINPTPPEGVTNNRWIEVNLYNETLSVYENGRLIFATLIASGMEPFYTRPGLFTIKTKQLVDDMQGSFEADRSDFYYIEEVPWTMYFDDARALHGAYWRTMFGYAQSHGCVNLSPGDAHWLFDWAVVGDWVYVWDPSGKTPTDPAYYGAGGA
jgi:hypothetical protein